MKLLNYNNDDMNIIVFFFNLMFYIIYLIKWFNLFKKKELFNYLINF